MASTIPGWDDLMNQIGGAGAKAPGQQVLDYWSLNANDVDRLLTDNAVGGGRSWTYQDGQPYANLTLGNGQKWNPSGAGSGINLYKKGARKELIPGVKGDAETASVYSDPYTQDTYEISGDLSNLTGTPGSGNHVNISYGKQGDKLVPIEAPGFWNWNDNHRADNMSLLTSAALMAPAFAGFSGVGAGAAAPGATAIDGPATGVTTGAEAAAQGGSLMSTLAPYDAGAQLVGTGGLQGLQGGASLGSYAGTAIPAAVDLGTAGGIMGTGATIAGGGGGLSGLFSGGLSAKQGVGIASTLADLYVKNKQANAMSDAYNSNQQAVNNTYAPGSPEYEYLAQKLARQDAASGRNSQQGQFATNLAAQIAGLKLNANTGVMNSQNKLLQDSLNNRYGGLSSLFANLTKYMGS